MEFNSAIGGTADTLAEGSEGEAEGEMEGKSEVGGRDRGR